MHYLLHTSVYGAPRIILRQVRASYGHSQGHSQGLLVRASYGHSQGLLVIADSSALRPHAALKPHDMTSGQVLDIERCINYPVSTPYLVK
jgi:hypothetical protein